MGKFDEKIALITGGSEGIGFATAQLFVDEGACVFITERRQEALNLAVKQIGRNIRAIQGDSSKLDGLDHVYQIIKPEKGKVDIVFANAGGPALPILNDGASIILHASRLSIKGRAATSVYFTTKAAVRSFAHREIRVNTISPDSTDIPLLHNLGNTKADSKNIVEQLAKSTVMGRLAQPIEIAKVALFLASDDSSYITGIELFVDGGSSQI